MDKLFHRNPQGWTERGTSRGWLKPTPVPHNPKLSALEQENKKLRSSIEDLMARLDRLEQNNGS